MASTGSTNADLLSAIADGSAQPGDWLVAETQTGGIGRNGRRWLSMPGNLYASVAIALRPGDPPAPSLALAIGLAAHDCAVALAPALMPQLKWPNDVLIGDAKLAGVLLQRRGDVVVAGIGLNLASAPPIADRPTTSLALGPDVAATHGIVTLMQVTADRIAQWRADLTATCTDWLAVAHPIGTPLHVYSDDGGRRIDGTFAGLANDGALRLRVADGAVLVVHAGDVSLGAGPARA